jgi:UDPglucose 6-dehydrogenase
MTGHGTHAARRIAIAGCGHVGVVTAAAFAEMGHLVIGVDVDTARVERLRAGDAPFSEPGLAELVRRNLRAGRLAFTTSYEQALAGAGFVFLCVNTPSTVTGAADLRNVRRAVTQIALAVEDVCPPPVLVNKSTSPIGTGETIEAILRREFHGAGTRPGITANPEFLREGSALADFFRPDRIVIGAESSADGEAVASLYAGIEAPVILTDLRTAEMIKYVSNAFLATRVSFVNEIARLCEALGVEADTVVRGASLDPRIGGAFFTPGIGYGGSCLPKDVAALCHTGDTVGLAMRVLQAVQETNTSQRKHAVNCIRRALGPLEGAVIGAWGVTFKGGTEDLRESPALDVIALLRNEGAIVRVYDPSLTPGAPYDFADEVCVGPIEAARGAGGIALLSDWPEFGTVDFDQVREAMAGRLIYDGRNLLRRADVEAAGLVYYGAGRPPGRDPTARESVPGW